MQTDPQELSWQAIQAIIGVKLSMDVLRFDGIGLHLKRRESNVIELDSDVEIIEDDSDADHLSDVNGNARSGTSEGSASREPPECAVEDHDKPESPPHDPEPQPEDKEDTWPCPKNDSKYATKEDFRVDSDRDDNDNDNSFDNKLSIVDYLEVTLSTDSETGHTCPHCELSFSSEKELSVHSCVPTDPPDEKKHACNFCVEKFSNSSELRKHINIHFPGMIDSKSSYCHLCQKDYTKTGFVNHFRKHTGERPFVCELCRKAFSQSSSLSIHMKFHLNVRKHACTVCEKKFVTKSELSRHMTVHTKQKSYYCGVCEKAFTRSDNMKKHEKTHG